MKLLYALGGVLFCAPASAQVLYGPAAIHGGTIDGVTITNSNVTGAGLPANAFWANAYGNCTWGTAGGNDVGPCVNAAIAAAAAAGGGTVKVPAGQFNYATLLVNNTSGVHIEAAGVGIVRDTAVSSHAIAATRLIWTGAAGTGPGLDIEPANGATQYLYSTDVIGITFDCASLLDTCVQIKQVGSSNFRFGQAEARKTGVLFSTNNIDGSGNQGNHIALWVRNIDPAYSASGVVIDGGAGPALYNSSYNPGIEYLTVAYGAGDGIVIGNTDNNVFSGIISAFHFGSATTGSPIVCANTVYTPPSGVPVSAACLDNLFTLVGSPMQFAGLTTGSVLTQGGGNTGTAALNPVTLVTNATSTGVNYTLNFASVSGVVAGESVNCGGTSSGVYPYTQVQSTTGTTVVLRNPVVIGGGINGVASGLSCTFSYALTSSAAPGTYTITAATASTFNITAPANGHTQSGISYAGGVVSFTDLTLPLTGTPVAGDTWTLVVPSPSKRNQITKVDKNNSVSDPHFEAGATGQAPFGANAIPYSYTAGGMVIGLDAGNFTNTISTASGPGSIIMGGINNTIFAGGTYGFVAGGTGNSVSGSNGSFATGQNCVASAISTFCFGFGNTASGSDGFAHGNSALDRGRFASEAYASGTFAAVGDAQVATMILRGTSSTGTAVRLTADGAAANATANCVNIPNNTAYLVTLDITAFDHTTVTKNAIWPTWTGLLTRGANAAATAVLLNTTPTPLTNGTLTGQAIAVTADTTNGCLNISYTPPTSNTDKFNIVAKVQTVEVQ